MQQITAHVGMKLNPNIFLNEEVKKYNVKLDTCSFVTIPKHINIQMKQFHFFHWKIYSFSNWIKIKSCTVYNKKCVSEFLESEFLVASRKYYILLTKSTILFGFLPSFWKRSKMRLYMNKVTLFTFGIHIYKLYTNNENQCNHFTMGGLELYTTPPKINKYLKLKIFILEIYKIKTTAVPSLYQSKSYICIHQADCFTAHTLFNYII